MTYESLFSHIPYVTPSHLLGTCGLDVSLACLCCGEPYDYESLQHDCRFDPNAGLLCWPCDQAIRLQMPVFNRYLKQESEANPNINPVKAAFVRLLAVERPRKEDPRELKMF